MRWFDPETVVDGVLEEVVDDLDQVFDPLMSMDRSENKTYFLLNYFNYPVQILSKTKCLITSVIRLVRPILTAYLNSS